jgi:hypothetical protein
LRFAALFRHAEVHVSHGLGCYETLPSLGQYIFEKLKKIFTLSAPKWTNQCKNSVFMKAILGAHI